MAFRCGVTLIQELIRGAAITKVSFLSRRLTYNFQQTVTSEEETMTESDQQINGDIHPPCNKYMKILDKNAFKKNVQIPTIIVPGDQLCRKLMQELKPFLLKVRGIKPVHEVEVKESQDKKVYLNPKFVKEINLSKFISEQVKLDEVIAASAHYETVEFRYEHWTLDQIVDSILPDDQDKVGGFSHVGHIIHLNLRDHLLPYKSIIGQIMLDKISHAKTVVNKLNTIDNTYRNFQMEIIAGDPVTVVNVKENRCEYDFDFALVYWNPRLSREHETIVKMIEPGDILYDVCAGVGPFAIPVAKKNCQVLANDLNPESYRWLQHNVQKSKVGNSVQCFNKDGRQFIKEDVAAHLKKKLSMSGTDTFNFKKNKFHTTINLPAMAVDFLDSFWNILDVSDGTQLDTDLTIIVHVYCFIKDIEKFKEKALELVEEKLNYDLPKENICEISFVRNVAPNKEMMRVSFSVPHIILTSRCPDRPNPLKRKLTDC